MNSVASIKVINLAKRSSLSHNPDQLKIELRGNVSSAPEMPGVFIIYCC
jgi:hypothetical protein